MNRTLLVAAIVLLAIVAATGAYLAVTTPRQPAHVAIPLTTGQRRLLAEIPASADTIALLPRAGVAYGVLETNPITANAVEQWSARQAIPHAPWMLGRATVVMWRTGGGSSFAIALDPVRAVLVRLYLLLGADVDTRWKGATLFLNAPEGETPIPAAELDHLLMAGARLPKGDALVVQRENARAAFPPIPRPVITTVRVTPTEVASVSHSSVPTAAPPAARTVSFPTDSLLSAAFAQPPSAVRDLDRLFNAGVSDLLRDGGSVVVYDIETRRLLPRPIGLVVVPGGAAEKDAIDHLSRTLTMNGAPESRVVDGVPVVRRSGLGYSVEYAFQGNDALFSLDGEALGRYLGSHAPREQVGYSGWAFRLDAARLAPVLSDAVDNPGFKLAMPRLWRSARDVNAWMSELKEAQSVTASDSFAGNVEELRVTLRSK